MTDFAKDHFRDVIVIVMRTPRLTGKPPYQEVEKNNLGEIVYEETEVSVSGYLVTKTMQSWQEQGISSDIAGIFICQYQDAIPTGSLIKVGEKQYHKYDVQYSHGLLGDGITKIYLRGEA